MEHVGQSWWGEGDKAITLMTLKTTTEGEGARRSSSTIAEEVEF
jgi:hypothetical protein